MAKQKEIKTNAMRILDGMGIDYTHASYECENFKDGIETADKLGLPREKVYKTLVTIGSSKQYFVFVVPIESELDMKKAAKAVGEKSVSMLPVKEINAVTGYIRGCCTALGMKKQYRTVISETAMELDKVYVSGGRLGCQISLKPEDLRRASGADYGDIIAGRVNHA